MVERSLSAEAYAAVIERRRAFRLPGYKSLTDVGFDGPWVTPLQMAAGSLTGSVLVAYNWLDMPSIDEHRAILVEHGYLPKITFNKVLDAALRLRGLVRSDIYLTQAFHLMPERRSSAVPVQDVQASFESITRHEIAGRPVIALGEAAARACRRAEIPFTATPHPSARGSSFAARAALLAKALATVA